MMMDCQVFLCPGKELPVRISSPHFCSWLVRFVPWPVVNRSRLLRYAYSSLAHWLQSMPAPVPTVVSMRPQLGRFVVTSVRHSTHTSHRGETLGTPQLPLQNAAGKKPGCVCSTGIGHRTSTDTAEAVTLVWWPVLLSSQLSSPLSIGGTITASYSISESGR